MRRSKMTMNNQETTTLNIYTVTQVFRAFSNDMTVQELAALLNVSYSTLARCKSGICPPSITFRALKNTFDHCKETYFQGSERRIYEATLQHLKSSRIDTASLTDVFETAGYDTFVNALLDSALANSGKAAASAPPAASEAIPDLKHHEASAAQDEVGASAQHLPGSVAIAQASSDQNPHIVKMPASAHGDPKVGIAGGLVGWIPIVALVAIGLLQVPLDELLKWITGNMKLFAAISLILAAAPVAFGLAVDAPIAWVRYKRRKPDATFSWDTWREVAKYGDPVDVLPGEGRFDASRPHLMFALLSNVTGMLCALSLIAFLAPLPGFLDYFAGHSWTEFFKASMVLAFFIAYHHTASQQRLPVPTAHGHAYNPDNYLYTRVHVWANIVHLVWTITLSAMFALCMLGYSIANFQRFDLPLSVLWPVAQAVLFLAYANISPYAMRVEVSSIGSFVASLVAIAVCMLGMVACFRFSWASVLATGAYLVLAAAAVAWRKNMDSDPKARAWIERESGSRVYGVLTATVIVALAAIGSYTSAIL